MKKIIFTVLCSIVFFACGDGTMSPQTFNSTAISIFTDAKKVMDEFDAKITAGVKSSDLPSIAAAAEPALEKINGLIEKLDAIKAPQSAESYKKSVLKSLEGVKTVIETGKKYSSLKEGYSKNEFNTLEKEYNNNRKQLSDELKNVATTQAEFMKAIKNK